MVAAVAVFALIVVLVFGSYWMIVVKPEEADDRALRRRLRTRRVRAAGPAIVKAREDLSGVRQLNQLLGGLQDKVSPLKLLIDRSGLRITVGTAILACVFAGVVALSLVNWITDSLPAALAGAVLAAVLPILYLRRKAAKRRAMFEEQFPEAMDLMARALRAGHALTTALKMTGDEIQDPVGAEFRRIFEEQNFGMSLTDALKGMAERMPILDAKFFVTALLTQREMGGNLSEVLDNLASVIRERFKVRRQVRVISAHGRITGLVVGFLPPAVGVLILIVSPSQMRLLIEDPLGRMMIVGAIVLQTIGVLIIKRIVDVEY